MVEAEETATASVPRHRPWLATDRTAVPDGAAPGGRGARLQSIESLALPRRRE